MEASRGICGQVQESKEEGKGRSCKGEVFEGECTEATDDEWEDSDVEDIPDQEATGTRVFAITSRPKIQPAESDAPPPPVPDPTWTRPTRTEKDIETNDDHIRASRTDAKGDMVNSLSGWARRTTIKLQSPKKQTLKNMVIDS